MKDKRYLLATVLVAILGACQLLYPSAPQPETPAPTQAATVPVPSQVQTLGGLQVHFIDVGQADCALVDADGKYVLIDGGNADDGRLVVSYLEQQGVQELEAVVCSHPHEDHVGGLSSVLAVFPTKAVYAPSDTYASPYFDDFMYYVRQQGLEVTIPAPGDSFTVQGSGDSAAEFTVMGPVESFPEVNDTSLVLLLEYENTAFLFTGDMELLAEDAMLDYWGRWETSIDVLKIGHHGSNTSSGYRLLYETDPDYGIISVGAGNDYGHPHKEPLLRFGDAGITLLRTDRMGTILAASDGQTVTLTWQNQQAEPTYAQDAESRIYIGNVNSLVFHSEGCTGLPSQRNRITFDSYLEAYYAGYRPCAGCLGQY